MRPPFYVSHYGCPHIPAICFNTICDVAPIKKITSPKSAMSLLPKKNISTKAAMHLVKKLHFQNMQNHIAKICNVTPSKKNALSKSSMTRPLRDATGMRFERIAYSCNYV